MFNVTDFICLVVVRSYLHQLDRPDANITARCCLYRRERLRPKLIGRQDFLPGIACEPSGPIRPPAPRIFCGICEPLLRLWHWGTGCQIWYVGMLPITSTLARRVVNNPGNMPRGTQNKAPRPS